MSLTASVSTVRSYLTTQTYRVIPNYQRGYAWKIDQWSALMDTLLETEGDQLFGTIVVKKQHGTSFSKDNLVDGQQRTVTLYLLLLALGAHANELLQTEKDPSVREYLETAYKVVLGHLYLSSTLSKRIGLSLVAPFSYHDEFKNIVCAALSLADAQNCLSGPFSKTDALPLKQDKTLVSSAYLYFHKDIHNRYTSHATVKNDFGREFIIYFEKITESFERLKYIEIALSENDDEQQVFEAMNTLSVPLTASDLIKNFFVYRIIRAADNQDSAVTFFQDTWESEFGKSFWGSAEHQKTELYILRGWIESENGNLILDRNLLSEYKEFYKDHELTAIENDLRQIVMFSKEIREVLDAISHEQTPLVTQEQIFAYRCIHVLRQPSLYSIWILLKRALADSVIDQDTYEKLLRRVEIFSVRRSVTDAKNFRQYSLTFLRHIKTSLSKYAHSSGDMLKEIDTFLQSDTVITDDLFSQKILDLRYRKKDGKKIFRMLLEAAEDDARKFDTNSPSLQTSERITRGLSLEHICPQNTSNWQHLQKSVDFVSAIHAIGNLTLLTTAQNSGLGNRSWAEKKSILSTFNLKEVESSVLQNAIWDETTIKERTKKLIEIYIRIWALP